MGLVWTKSRTTSPLSTIEPTSAKKRKVGADDGKGNSPLSKRMKHCSEEPSPESNSGWSSLPDELLGLIFQRLGVSDYVRLGGVCRHWSSVFEEKHYPPAPEEPWIWDPKHRANGFYCPPEKRWYRHLHLPLHFMEWRCYGSQHGWLIFARQNPEGNTPCLVNPFSGVQIQLRRLPKIQFLVPCMGNDKFYCSLPPDNPQSIVVYINLFGVMGICRPKSAWVSCNRLFNCVSFTSAIFHKGSLYAATSKGELCLVDLATHGVDVQPTVWTLLAPPREHMWDNEYLFSPMQLMGLLKCSITLIEYQSELLMCCEMHATATVDIFKANLELRKWEQAGNMGPRKLFISEYWPNFMPKPRFHYKAKKFERGDGNEPLCHYVRPYSQVLLSPHL